MRAAAAVNLVAALLGLTCGWIGAAAQTVDGEAGSQEEAVWLEPRQLMQVVEGTNHSVRWFTILPDVASVTAQVEDERVCRVDAVGPVLVGSPLDNFTFSGIVNVSATFIGYNKLRVFLYDGLDSTTGEAEMPMSVLLSYQKLSDLFMMITSVLVALLYVVMGATLDMKVIAMIVKKPIGPLVGIVCQYLFMPMIAFGLAKATFPDNPLGQLGLFLGGSCPGGGASNMWTHLLGGSLDLSIMMTFISTVTAFATVPLWVLVMGPTIVGDADFIIPYKDIAVLVFSLSMPCAVGILIAKFLPRVGKVIGKLLTPLTLFNVVFLFTFGVYANLYVFSLFEAKTILAGFGLPFLGYLSGIGLASLLKLPIKDRIAISIETGIQNMTIAIIILKLTLEAPASELTVVFPAAAVLMTPIPLLAMLIIRRVYLWHYGPQKEDEKTEKEKEVEAKETNGRVESGGGKVEAGGGGAVKDGSKTKTGGGKEEQTDGGKVERNGTAVVVEGGIDNPGVEVEDTF
ncbi:ileal sodium/bile acid cotransporter-like [Portunus trituberculatus]|uniref:ileal sodium/bile acid cotransporter-like n=1 Tax=Portunus trituberculatus TaxID=210409 RepID=UPI001E1D2048|nr:ileal sodium/bile acid cotransporter-like [Portunus trituberculatus]